ncbi:MAG: RNA pseudouridine synthase [Colwelliaceae bacterium]|nr:RNA pseudouridine synthase [Colwelliaceae bacterium]
MTVQKRCFTPYKESIEGYDLPERFTFPFYYQPHPLCILATKELQHFLTNQDQLQHSFGLSLEENIKTESTTGKMFGVLVVKSEQGEVGYLSAFSGKLEDANFLTNFVPPVFDMLKKDSLFLEKQVVINNINREIDNLEQNPKINELTRQLEQMNAQFECELQTHRERIVDNRKIRKEKRFIAEQQFNENTLGADEFKLHSIQMSRESVEDKNKLLEIKTFWQSRIDDIEEALNLLLDEINALKKQRKKLSNNLQKKLFQQYKFLNQSGEEKSLLELFKDTILQKPPAGAGDCAAPKLIQYAFENNYTPIAMAEFWWGKAPKSEIRQHKNFYPACQGKCQPILAHMLDGIDIDENPLLENPAEGRVLPIVFQDNDIVVVNKPANFLSVPGKSIEDSVSTRIKSMFPHASGPIIVHRLDMATSGLLIVALNSRAHKKLQQQFINRTIEKRYVAIIEGELSTDTGIIELPLTVDLNDRPRQLVCYKQGKKAFTTYKKFDPQPVINSKKKLTKVYLYPKTGRTHQLRVHCAHIDGLNMPILGDDLYGNKNTRLHLHAEYIAFQHPVTQTSLQFQIDADF